MSIIRFTAAAISVIAVHPFCTSNEAWALEDDLDLELPVVISASRINQSVLSSPSAVTVIDKNMISASGYTDIADIMRLVPGFQAVKPDGRTFSVNYHGGGWEFTNRLQVLVNGRTAYLATLSVVDWDTLGVHIKDIERIEVVRGPSASAYGSNSFAAAINIITVNPSVSEPYSVSARVGNKGEREILAKWSQQLDNFDYRLSLWKRRHNGFDDFHDFRDIDNLSFAGTLSLDDGSTLDSEISLYNGQTGAAEFDELLKRDRKVSGFSAKLAWQKQLSMKSDMALKFYINNRDEDDLTFTLPLPEIFGLTPEQFTAVTGSTDYSYRTGYSTHKTRRLDAEAQYSWFNEQGFKAVTGVGLRQDFLKSISYFPQKGEIEDSSARAFLNIQQSLSESWLLNAGLLYEHAANNDNHWSPRLSLNWNFLPQQSIRLSASQAYRQPSLLEANFDTRTELSNGLLLDLRYLSNEEMRAEKILSLNVGYQGKQGRWSWELNAYRDASDHLIDFANDRSLQDLRGDYATRIGNYDSYDSYGIEGEVNYRPELDKFIRLHFNSGRSHHNSLLRLAPNEKRIYKDRAPEFSVGLLMAYPVDSWIASYSLQYMDAIYWDGFGDRVKPYTRMDFKLSKFWEFGDKELEVTFAAQSFNGSYIEFNENLTLDPQFYLSVNLAGL